MSKNLKSYRKFSFHDNSEGVWKAKMAENLAELLWLADSHLESSFLVECIKWHHLYTGRTINYMKTTLRKHLEILFLHTLKVLVAQSCLTLCDLVDCSPPGSSAHGILQARTLKEVGIYSLLQEIFSAQGLYLGLLHCRCVLDCPSHQGNCHNKNLSHIIGL